MDVYAPMPMILASLEPGEVVKHTFLMQPAERERLLGFGYMYKPKLAEFRLHMTDRRIVVEPDPGSKTKNVIMKGLLLGTALFVPGAGDAAGMAMDSIREGEAAARSASGHYIEIRYPDIHTIETFRQGLWTPVRLRLRSRPNDEVVFGVRGKGQMTASHGAEFVALLRGLVASASNAAPATAASPATAPASAPPPVAPRAHPATVPVSPLPSAHPGAAPAPGTINAPHHPPVASARGPVASPNPPLRAPSPAKAQAATASAAQPRRGSSGCGVLAILLLVALVIGGIAYSQQHHYAGGVGGGSGIPDVSGTYTGTAHNSAGFSAPMSLTLDEQGTSLSGTFAVSRPLGGSGPLQGEVDASGDVTFEVVSSDGSNVVTDFTGSLNSSGNELTGSYTVNNGQSGTWDVTQ